MTPHPVHEMVTSLIGDGPQFLAAPEAGWWPVCGEGHLACCVLRPEPRAAKAARQFTYASLSSFGVHDLADETAMVMSELVTNAVRYGVRPGLSPADPDAHIGVLVANRAGYVVCIVTDASPRPPLRMAPDDAAEGGRGLHVVETLSSRWGWRPLNGSRKAVWAALRHA